MRKRILVLAVVAIASLSLYRATTAQSFSWERVSSNLIFTQGKVGIGTRYPIKKLHVEGDVWIGRPNGSNLAINTPAGSVRFNSQGSDIIFPEGNVGIGTLDPTKKLTVDGTVRAKEIIVDSGWADHVFDSDYKLLSIEELATFVDKNRSLPGMTTAEEVNANGVGVSESLTKLLVKVEELSLYLIDMNDRVRRLEFKATGGGGIDKSFLESLNYMEIDGLKLYYIEDAQIDRALAQAVLTRFRGEIIVLYEVNSFNEWSMLAMKVDQKLTTIIVNRTNEGWVMEEVGSLAADKLICNAPELLINSQAKASLLAELTQCPQLNFSGKYKIDFGVLGEVIPLEAQQSVLNAMTRFGKPTTERFQYKVRNPLVFASSKELVAFELEDVQDSSNSFEAIVFKTNRKWHSLLFKKQSLNWLLQLLNRDFKHFLTARP